MPRGGFRSAAAGRVGRPTSPAQLAAQVAQLVAKMRYQLAARPGQLDNWTEPELRAVVDAAAALAFPFQNEREARWHREGLADD